MKDKSKVLDCMGLLPVHKPLPIRFSVVFEFLSWEHIK